MNARIYTVVGGHRRISLAREDVRIEGEYALADRPMSWAFGLRSVVAVADYDLTREAAVERFVRIQERTRDMVDSDRRASFDRDIAEARALLENADG